MTDTNRKPIILIVTVTEVESKAVIEVFREISGKDPSPRSIGDRMYHDLGEVKGAHVFLALSEMGAGGLGAAQQAVQKAIAALCPSAVIMVGIAFGVDKRKQAIGDILVSQQLWLYELQRVSKTEIKPRGDKPHASAWLINHLRGAALSWKGAKVRFGLVLTGEKLVDNLDYRKQLKQFEAEAIGGEMEGAGVYAACQDNKVDWILVKAICDWADGNKGGPNKASHQATAAHNAASFVLYALHFSPLKRGVEAQIGAENGEQNDLQILVQTDRLLSSLRALDNAIHLHLGELAACDLGSLTKRRESIIKQINDFAQKEELVDDIRESLKTLEVFKVNANMSDRALVSEIFECGADILQTLSKSTVTPFPGREALRDLLIRIEKAQKEQDVQEIINESNKILEVLNRRRLGKATEAFGTLKGQILFRHPGLRETAPPGPGPQATLPIFTMIRLSEETEETTSWSKIAAREFRRNYELAADPVFDIMLKYDGSHTIAVWSVGIHLLHRKLGYGGTLGSPEDVQVHSQLKVCWPLKWKENDGNIDKKVETRFRNPKEMSRDNPRLRFTLMLENFCENNASTCEIRFYVDTENGPVESESYWLSQ